MSIGVVGKVDGHREMFPLCDDSRSCLPIRKREVMWSMMFFGYHLSLNTG